MNGVHDMGGMHGFGPVEPEPNEPVFHARMGRPRAARCSAPWATPAPGTSTWSRRARDAAAARPISPTTYYEIWFARRSRRMLLEHGLVGADELAAGHALRPASR